MLENLPLGPLFSEKEISLIRGLYSGLQQHFGPCVSHRNFVEACRGAGFAVPSGVFRESLWIFATGIFAGEAVGISEGQQSENQSSQSE
jgi:hypothetical protein